MMSDTLANRELIPEEFRHEVVGRVVRGILNNSIVLSLKKMTSDNKEMLKDEASSWGRLVASARDYCIGQRNAEDLRSLEDKIFTEYVFLVAMQVLDESGTPLPEIEQGMASLRHQIESNNRLLMEAVKILRALLESIEGP